MQIWIRGNEFQVVFESETVATGNGARWDRVTVQQRGRQRGKICVRIVMDANSRNGIVVRKRYEALCRPQTMAGPRSPIGFPSCVLAFGLQSRQESQAEEARLGESCQDTNQRARRRDARTLCVRGAGRCCQRVGS